MVWLDPFVFLNPSSTDPWHPYLNCREEKEEAPLKTGEEAAPSIYHLSPIGSDEFSLCVPASGWDLWSELWRWKGFQWPEGCQLNFHSSLAMAYQKNGGQTTRKGSNTSCVCFMLLLTTTFSLESPDLRHHRKGKHYTMTSEILEWNSWQKFPPNCRTGCVDGVLQRQRPLGSDDFPGKGQVDQKMVQMCRYGWKVCC